jgi:hypothetical protein
VRLARTDGLCALHKWEVDQGLLVLAAEEPQCSVEACGKEGGKRDREGSVSSDRRDKQRRNGPDPKLPMTEEMHGTGTGYRYGCRCAKCRLCHSKEQRKRRWMLRYGPGGPMGPEVRERIIEALRRSGSMDDVVAEVQVKHQTIYSAARAVPDFGILMNQLTAGWPAGRNK